MACTAGAVAVAVATGSDVKVGFTPKAGCGSPVAGVHSLRKMMKSGTILQAALTIHTTRRGRWVLHRLPNCRCERSEVEDPAQRGNLFQT